MPRYGGVAGVADRSGGCVASIERTAYPQFKRAVPVRELDEAFTPTAGEIAWAREQTRTAEHLLALVVLLKSCHRLGYFPALAEVPPPVTEHVRGLLELKPEVQPDHDSDRTLRQHKSLVRPGWASPLTRAGPGRWPGGRSGRRRGPRTTRPT